MTVEELLEHYTTGERCFSGISLKKAGFRKPINWTDIDFAGAELNRTVLRHSYLTRANFEEASLINCDWASNELIESCFRRAILRDGRFGGCTLVGADFTKAKLRDVDFTRAVLIEANFLGAEVNASVFDREGIVFCNTVMPDGTVRNDPKVMATEEFLNRYEAGERNFNDIILHRADLRGAKLEKISMGGAFLMNANLCSTVFNVANLESVNFSGSDCQGATLGGILDGASFVNVDLRNADLSGSSMVGTQFINADLTRTDWSDRYDLETFLWNTTVPSGKLIPDRLILPQPAL